MSAAAEIVAELRARGARLRTDGQTVFVAPRSVLTPELSERVRAHKPELLSLLTAAPPELALAGHGPSKGAPLSARGQEALGGKAPAAPARRPLVAAPPEARSEWLRSFMEEDASIPFAVIDHGTLGRFVLTRAPGALEALSEEHALPVLAMRELLALAPHGVEGLRALLDTRRVFGPHVAFRGVHQRPLDG